MKNEIRSRIQKAGIAVTAALLLVTTVQQMRAGQQTRSAAHAPDWTNKGIEEKLWKLLGDEKSALGTMGEADFRGHGAGLALPEGGPTVMGLTILAPGAALN